MTDALGHDDSAVFQSGGVPFASYRWWKQWFLDKTPSPAGLCHFAGQLVAHNGSNDSQTPGEREFSAAERALQGCPVAHRFTLHQGMGHTLSPDSPIAGPIDLGVRDELVRELVDLLK